MIKKDKIKYDKIKFDRGDRIFSIILAVFFLFCAILCFDKYQDEVYQQKAIDNGVIVEAKLVKVTTRSSSTGNPPRSSTYYKLVYSYTDKDGLEYTGTYGPSFKSEMQAQAYVGSKIEIYIDGDGHSIPVGVKPQKALMLTFSILILLACLASIAMYVYQFKNKMTKYEEQTSKEREEEREKERLAYWEKKREEHQKQYGEALNHYKNLKEEMEKVQRESAEQDKLWHEYQNIKKKYDKQGIRYFYSDFLKDRQIQSEEQNEDSSNEKI
ncbi:MAG: hypothetical protein K2O08_06295 [Clostridia bacterium]|nr:hypothetical protein [Clostridia bacterium]